MKKLSAATSSGEGPSEGGFGVQKRVAAAIAQPAEPMPNQKPSEKAKPKKVEAQAAPATKAVQAAMMATR
ncbi:hypothetical protein [Caulobacter flavus]|uniref:hypothetical protein n=1 Tax=Caulobacter flavus TaxID=1679497 RepID=UPI0011AF4664|nr:hypothetical protein [Caulobacter flavus]